MDTYHCPGQSKACEITLGIQKASWRLIVLCIGRPLNSEHK
jgi:hypothetical protein